MKENSIHREIIEDHFRNPTGNCRLEDFTHEAAFQSKKTGNLCDLRLQAKDARIVEIGFQLQGSALAMASASIMVSKIRGMLISESQEMIKSVLEFLNGTEGVRLPEELAVYETIRRFPDRRDSALRTDRQ